MYNQLYRSQFIEKYKKRLWKQIRVPTLFAIIFAICFFNNVPRNQEMLFPIAIFFVLTFFIFTFGIIRAINRSRYVPIKITDLSAYLELEYFDKDEAKALKLNFKSFKLSIDSSRNSFDRTVMISFKNDNHHKIEFYSEVSYNLTNKVLIELYQKIKELQLASA